MRVATPFLTATAIALAGTVGSAPAAASCMDEIAKTESWLEESYVPRAGGPKENWFGSKPSALDTPVRDHLSRAKALAAEGKEEACMQSVEQAHRAIAKHSEMAGTESDLPGVPEKAHR